MLMGTTEERTWHFLDGDVVIRAGLEVVKGNISRCGRGVVTMIVVAFQVVTSLLWPLAARSSVA
jgi:hypothetical protein|uniref:Uncharacterized protein n=1 Tax=Oryza sativa subsp. japonica TaxID=39947 RepID=Q6ES20_ORYSJ|nr:hypothetical protein [Oryza sativa Japonica Group]